MSRRKGGNKEEKGRGKKVREFDEKGGKEWIARMKAEEMKRKDRSTSENG